MPEVEKNKSEEYEEFTFEVPLTRYDYINDTSIELQDTKNIKNNPNTEVRTAVVLIGDRFYKGSFFSAAELEKVAPQWEGTLHDINHMGTTFGNGQRMQSNILYFVGWQDNVQYNKESKSVSMDIHADYNTYYGEAWKSYINLCEKAGQMPNVSISFLGKRKLVQARDLPAGSNYKAYGYSEDDYVSYIYDVLPTALSTVLKGICNNKQGCGIAINNSDETTSCCEPELSENKKEDAEKRAYLEKRLRKFKGGQ